MEITVLLFAALREAAGTPRLTLTIDSGLRAADVLASLSQRLPNSRELLHRSALAVNEEYARSDLALHDGDTVAVIPPVSGG
jgi:molybdopterin converting factor subunit 1